MASMAARSNSALWRDAASAVLRVVMSMCVPAMNSGRPCASRLATLPRVSSQTQRPSRWRTRFSHSSAGSSPRKWRFSSAADTIASSGCERADHCAMVVSCRVPSASPSMAAQRSLKRRPPVCRSHSQVATWVPSMMLLKRCWCCANCCAACLLAVMSVCSATCFSMRPSAPTKGAMMLSVQNREPSLARPHTSPRQGLPAEMSAHMQRRCSGGCALEMTMAWSRPISSSRR